MTCTTSMPAEGPHCPGSGTDRYVREEGSIPVERAFPIAPPWLDGDVLTWPMEAQRNYFSWLSLLRIHALSTEQARSRALREALETIASMRGSSDKIQCLFVIQEVAQIASKALTAAPLPPDAAGDGELLDWLEKNPTRELQHRFTGMGRSKWKCYGDPSPDGYDTPRDAIRAAILAEGETKA